MNIQTGYLHCYLLRVEVVLDEKDGIRGQLRRPVVVELTSNHGGAKSLDILLILDNNAERVANF